MKGLNTHKIKSAAGNFKILPNLLISEIESLIHIDFNLIIEFIISGLLVDMGSRTKPDLIESSLVHAPKSILFSETDYLKSPLNPVVS